MKLLQFLFNHHQKPTTMKQFRILAAIVLLLTGVSVDTLAQSPTIQKEVRLVSPTTGQTGYVGLKASAGTTSYTLTMPGTAPTADQVLTVSSVTGGSVSLTWTSPASASWSLAGNAGTNSLTQFLGTTDAQPLLFKTNGATRLTLGASGGATFSDLAGTAGTATTTNTDEGVVIANNNGLISKASYESVVAAGLSSNTSGLTIGGPLTVQGLITGNNGATLSGTTSITGNTSINTTGTGTTSIGNASSTIATAGTLSHTGDLTVSGATTLSSTLQVAGATTLNATTTNGLLTANSGATISGTLTINGPLAAGTSSPSTGGTGWVLQSNGASAAPTWSAAYIKARGVVPVTGDETKVVTGLTGLDANDAITVSLEGGAADMPIPSYYIVRTAGTGFTVYFSAAFTGSFNYTVVNVE
jgi:hypothetical protein